MSQIRHAEAVFFLSPTLLPDHNTAGLQLVTVLDGARG